MSADLYLSYHLAEIGRTLVIEGDGFSVWVYLLKEEEEEVDFSGFLCSQGTVVETDAEVEHFLKEGHQPPLLREYANEKSVVKDLSASDIGVEVLDSNTLTVSVKGEEYLLVDVEEKQCYSIAVSQDGPYGYVLMSDEREEDEEDDE